MNRRWSASLLSALLLTAAACGTSGDGAEARPIEVLYFVSGGPNLTFEFVAAPDANCDSDGTGIQGFNLDHQFGDRVFQTPHLFVLENARQPIRAVIRNTSELPIAVDMFLGIVQVVGGGDAGLIKPGACATIQSAPPATTPCKSAPGRFPCDVRGPQVQVEVCSPRTPTGEQDLSIGCGAEGKCSFSTEDTCTTDSNCPEGETCKHPHPPLPLDASIGFFATTGDIVASTLTRCQLPPFQEDCRTPATFFWERPQDVYAAVATVNPGQSPEGQPKARVRSELYIDGDRMDFSSGTETIVEHDF